MSIRDFHSNYEPILQPVFEALEAGFAKLQGIATKGPVTVGVAHMPRFAAEPYLLVTTLLEGADGSLIPITRDGGR